MADVSSLVAQVILLVYHWTNVVLESYIVICFISTKNAL